MATELKIKPLGLRVVVKPQEKEAVTTGGLIVPPTAQDNSSPKSGVVAVLGTGEEGKKFEVSVGDRIFFKSYSAETLEVEGVEYLVVHQDDILAVVK